MNKKSLLMLVACLLSCELHAAWYSGINLGVNSVTVKKELTYPLEEQSPSLATFRSGYTSFYGQLLGGYERGFSENISAAVELNIDFLTGKARHTINGWYFTENVYAEEQLEYGFALFLLPAYKYNDMLRFFAGPGISRNRFAIGVNNTAGNIGISANIDQWITGGGLKAGTITKLTPNLDLLLTYQFMQYSSASWTHIEPLSEETLSGRYKPNTSTFLVGLRFNFSDSTATSK